MVRRIGRSERAVAFARWSRRVGALLLGSVLCASCHGATPAFVPATETPAACAERLRVLTNFVRALPAETVASATRVDLPVSTLGALPGPGPVLEMSSADAALDGVPLRGADLAARVEAFRQWLDTWSASAPAVGAQKARPEVRVLYVAAAADTDVQTLRAYIAQAPVSVALRLLVRVPKPLGARGAGDGNPDASRDSATHLLLEADPKQREKIAEEGYARLAPGCSGLAQAVSSVHGRDARQRWPALKTALDRALPSCDCGHVDTANLQPLVAAEQRASGATLGWVPLSFLRDERCGASMPLRSMKKLIQQIETFDADFAGGWQRDALSFTDVVTNDRLRVFFCTALPGETLAAKQRARATLYLRAPGASGCEPWQFEPLSPGAPMGTWRRAPGPGRTPLAYHYWQAAEEIRVFGPADMTPPSRPTDARDWACEETHRLTAIDDESIGLVDGGRWFLDEAACRRAPESVPRSSPCVVRAAAPSEAPAITPPPGAPSPKK